MNANGHWRDWQLERFLLDELEPEQSRKLEIALERDEELRERLEALRASNVDIIEAYPAEVMRRRIEARMRAQVDQGSHASWGGSTWRRFSLVAAAVAVVLGALWWPGSGVVERGGDSASHPSSGAGETVRVKGAVPQLRVYRKTKAGAEELDDHSRAAAGDVVQLGYVAAGRAHGVIVSIDGRGSVTLHHPASPDEPAQLAPSGKTVLDHAYELDGAPAYERFFLIAASRPLEVDRVLDAARELAQSPERARSEALSLGENVEQISFLLEKE